MKYQLLGVVVLALSWSASVSWSEPPAKNVPDFHLKQPEELKLPAPELALVTHYLGKEKPKANKELAGHVVLVHFWSSGSPSSFVNFVHFAEWRKLYKADGLQIVAIHTADVGQSFPFHGDAEDQPPTKEEEAALKKLMESIKKLAIANPAVADTGIDANGELKHLWKVRRTPTFYLIDKKGNLRYCYEGFLEYQKLHNEKAMRAKVEELLKEDVDK